MYDHFTVFYEYESGIRVYFTCRQQDHCTNYVDEVVVGTKGTAEVLAKEIRSQDGSVWKYEGGSANMYQLEHAAMFRSIRNGQPIDNGHYMCNSTMLAIMGRMAAYRGQTLDWETCLADDEKLRPEDYTWGDLETRPVAIPGVTPVAESGTDSPSHKGV